MRERRAVERQRQPERALQRDGGREARPPHAHDDFDQRAENDEDREARRERREHRPAAEPRRAEDRGHRAGDDGDRQPLATPKRSPRFQASEKPNGATKQAVSSSAPQVRLKKGAPTVIFSPVNCSSASG